MPDKKDDYVKIKGTGEAEREVGHSIHFIRSLL